MDITVTITPDTQRLLNYRRETMGFKTHRECLESLIQAATWEFGTQSSPAVKVAFDKWDIL